jgi:hypothetical protein
MNLFRELSTNSDQVLYTLERGDNEYPSIYRLYMETEDLTEFEFANKYFDSFAHWKRICQSPSFIPYISQWREELELKIRARALSSLIKKSKDDSSIAKYLLDKNWVDKLHTTNPVTNLRGRPSKNDIRDHLTLITNNHLIEQENYERIQNL